MRTLLPVLLLLAGCRNEAGHVPPGKIVSNNPCVDAILAEIAAPDQIGAVSLWSHAPGSGSAPLAWARRYPAIGSGAEDVIAAQPSLAFVGAFGSLAALERAGVRHKGLGVPISISESRAQILNVAREIGRNAQGQILAKRIDLATTAPSDTKRPSAIIWLSGGFVPGKGTLQDELLARAGFVNASARYGLKQWDQLPLESLIRRPPDIIFTPVATQGDRALALRYRALKSLNPQPKIVALPEKLLNCGGPSIPPLMAILKAAR
jgi:iron complex transport system substrate-binding protein